MGDILGLHHVCINTRDMDKSIAFYETLGFSLIGRETCDFGEYAMLHIGSSRLELIQPNQADADTFGNCGSIAHIGLDVADVDKAFESLKEKGVAFVSEAVNVCDYPLGGLRAVTLLGPSDEQINLYAFNRKL